MGSQLMSVTAPPAPVQKIETQYATAMAVQQPRQLKAVEALALNEAAMLGEYGYYGWGAAKDRVEGPSKHLAMMLVRCWGNCAIEMDDVQDWPDAWIFTAKFIDLETGFTLPRQFRQSKHWTVHGKFDAARKEDMRFQIGQSKAVRNVVLNALPKWLVTRAMDRCKAGVREAIEQAIKSHGIGTVQTRAMERLAKLGADEARVLEAMGRKAVAALTLEDLVILRGSIACLEEGSDTIDALFPLAADKDRKRVAESPASELLASKADEKPADPATLNRFASCNTPEALEEAYNVALSESTEMEKAAIDRESAERLEQILGGEPTS